LLAGLIESRTDVEKDRWPSKWDAKEALARLSALNDAYTNILLLDIFDETKAFEIQANLTKAKKEHFDAS